MNDPVELRTKRLLLRPFSLADVGDIFRYYSNPELAKFIPLPQPYTRRDTEEFVARRVLAPWRTDPTWVLVVGETVIGVIDLNISVAHETAELGYTLDPAHWGKGFMPEAARAVVAWCFEERRLAKVFATVDARNTRSLRVVEKLGMTREGVLRRHIKRQEVRIDEVYYGVLLEEWDAAHAKGTGLSPA